MCMHEELKEKLSLVKFDFCGMRHHMFDNQDCNVDRVNSNSACAHNYRLEHIESLFNELKTKDLISDQQCARLAQILEATKQKLSFIDVSFAIMMSAKANGSSNDFIWINQKIGEGTFPDWQNRSIEELHEDAQMLQMSAVSKIMQFSTLLLNSLDENLSNEELTVEINKHIENCKI